MLIRGSADDKNHNPYILLELSFLIIFHKGCFLCHVLVYKWCLNTRSAFKEHSLLPAIFLMCFSWILYVSDTRCPLTLLLSADIWMMGIKKASNNSTLYSTDLRCHLVYTFDSWTNTLSFPFVRWLTKGKGWLWVKHYIYVSITQDCEIDRDYK